MILLIILMMDKKNLAILLNDQNQYQLKIQKVLFYENLPGIFKSKARYQKSLNGEV